MAQEAPVLSIQAVPTVPGVFRIRFSDNAESIVSRHFVDGTWRLHEIGSKSGRCLTVDKVFEKLKKRYRKRYPGHFILETQQIVMDNWNGNPDGYSIMKLGQRLYVALSSHFIAGFDTRLGKWIVIAISVAHNEFVLIKPDGGLRLTAVLTWDGSGLETTAMLKKATAQALPDGYPMHMLPVRVPGSYIQVGGLFMLNDLVGAYTQQHSFAYHPCSTGFNWTIVTCGHDFIGNDHHPCFYTGRRCAMIGTGRHMITDLEENTACELGMPENGAGMENELGIQNDNGLSTIRG